MLMGGVFGEQADRPQPHERQGSVNVVARLTAELPWFGAMCAWSQDQVLALTRDFLKGTDSNESADAIIFSQAVNDWLDLMIEIGNGWGRPATRSARALVEHAINLSDLAADPSLSPQYIDHLAVADVRLRDAAIGLSRLIGNDRRSAQRRLRARASKAEPVVARGRRRYHNRWWSQWHKDSLKNRADTHGLSSLYDYYAIASLVQHGAAGGSIGTRNTIAGEIVHRIGSALALCPDAYHEGTRAFRAVVDAASRIRPDLDWTGVHAVTDEWLEAYPLYRAAMLQIDKTIWPTTPPMHQSPILAVARNGTRRWFIHDPEREVMIPAETPALGIINTLPAMVEEKIAEFLDDPDQHISPEERFFTIALPGLLHLRPRLDAAPVPDTGLLPVLNAPIPRSSSRPASNSTRARAGL
jgi:hypothetical protein